ncbi:hypothetical protein [Salmonella enterica]|uniref:hypothetical protein n=1 Tax=Salmonella enterica TaxID=28901 RepID=UPI00107B0B3A|nr:hypothetical protein [Salmonella enterica]EHQ9197636.1 hypothetical protein [Salmonella enterica subsp. diarizonae serovar 50:k:z:[z50],[z57],[z68], [z86]]EAA0681878.1 hypothetical protein [Salmonella enterica subsp. diarizonae]EAS3781508.1 hypothetical protein [Salmonella enterica]EBI8903170.1 hypothetical protein [Salmonella enterica]ECC3893776.1 hypothetical protein [Salmonella enterica subsp. diarizonae]
MNFDEISTINNIFKNSLEGNFSWSLSQFTPDILSARSEIMITSCYESSVLNNGGKLYLYRYRVPEYYGDHDTFYNVEKIRLSLIQHNQISWQSYSDSAPIYNLYEYVSSKYSGIGSIF